VLADTGNDNACSLPVGFLGHDVGHYGAVFVVEMACGFICNQKVEGLDEGTYHSDALLLAEAHETDRRVHFVGDAERFEPLLYLSFRLVVRQAVLYLDILHSSEFGEESELLKEQTDVALAKLYPIRNAKVTAVATIEEDAAVEIMPVADDETAERALACAALCLDEVGLSTPERDLLAPDVALNIRLREENLRQSVIESNAIH